MRAFPAISRLLTKPPISRIFAFTGIGSAWAGPRSRRRNPSADAPRRKPKTIRGGRKIDPRGAPTRMLADCDGDGIPRATAYTTFYVYTDRRRSDKMCANYDSGSANYVSGAEPRRDQFCGRAAHEGAGVLPTRSAGPQRGRFGRFPTPNQHNDRTNRSMRKHTKQS